MNVTASKHGEFIEAFHVYCDDDQRSLRYARINLL